MTQSIDDKLFALAFETGQEHVTPVILDYQYILTLTNCTPDQAYAAVERKYKREEHLPTDFNDWIQHYRRVD